MVQLNIDDSSERKAIDVIVATLLALRNESLRIDVACRCDWLIKEVLEDEES